MEDWLVHSTSFNFYASSPRVVCHFVASFFCFKDGVNSFSKRDPQAQGPKPKKLTGQRNTQSEKNRTGKVMQTALCCYSIDSEFILHSIEFEIN